MSFDDLHFQLWQWLLLLPLLWAYLAWRYQSNQQGQSASSSMKNTSIADLDISSENHFYHPLVGKLIKASQGEFSHSPSFWKQATFWWYGLIFSLLLIALAQPVLTGKRLPDLPPERDIIFLVDVSVSMQLADYQHQGRAIKRIDVLRNLLDEFTIKMKGEKISVILFAENAYVLVPLTSDQNLIRKMLSRISTTLAGRYTAVGDALLMARNQSLNTQQDDSKNKRHQTFILFTDADVSRGKVSSSAAAKVIAEHNIPIYTIAIGSSDSEQGAEEIQGGLYQPVDLKLLEDIAEQTKAKSYQVDSAQAMQQALDNILKQRQNIATPKPRYETRQLYFYPLILALLLLASLQFLRLIKNNEKWGGVLRRRSAGLLL